MSRPLALVAALTALAALAPAPARADTPPSVWDFARDPGARERWDLHVRVERLLQRRTMGPDAPVVLSDRELELHCEAALDMLEEAHAETSSDATLRFDLGLAQYELAEVTERADLFTKAAKTLVAALAAAPDHPAATEALGDLVYCYAKLDRSDEELVAWHRYIPRLLDPRSRTLAEMNMGEAEMRLGKVDDALATFREVLRGLSTLPNASSTYALTLWDLAVALDRAGDPRSALDTAAQAARQTAVDSRGFVVSGRGLLAHDPAVFFVPVWERQWYLALGSTVLGTTDPDAREGVAYLVEAEHEWDTYVAQATFAGGKDRYLPLARMRRDHVRALRQAAQKRLPKGTPLPIEGDTD